jgi:type I restriction enzyme S subunit
MTGKPKMESINLQEVTDFFADGDWIESKDQSDTGFRLVQTGNVGIGRYLAHPDRARYISVETFNRLNCTKLNAGDILISRLPDPVGRACLFPGGFDAITAVDCTIVRVKEDLVLPEWVHFITQTQGYQKQVDAMLGGSTRLRITRKELGGIKIPLPPLAEQRKIAEILRTWDEAIETAEAELTAKQERKRGLMQKLLAPVAEGSGKGIDWVRIKLGVLGEFYSGLSGKSAADFGSGSPFISYNSVFGRSRCYIEGQPLVRVEQGESQNNVTYGDIILTGSSETADEVAMSSLYCDQAPAYLNSFCIGYSYDKQRLIPEYAEQYFRGQAFRRSVFPLAQGSTRFNISKDGLAKVEIRIPPISAQRKISEILLSADGDIELISNRIEALRTQKRGLLQKLLTGEVRVAA